MHAAAAHQKDHPRGDARLLWDCGLLADPQERVPARERLERAVGGDFAALLLTALSRDPDSRALSLFGEAA